MLVTDICNTIADVNREIGKVFGLPDWRPYEYSMESLGVGGPERALFFEKHPEVFQRATPLEGAVDALNALSRRFEIAYVTARPEHLRNLTEWWLRENGFPPGLLIMGLPKALAVARLTPVACVEDAPEEIAALSRVSRVVPVGYEYNGSQNTWKDIREVLDSLQGE